MKKKALFIFFMAMATRCLFLFQLRTHSYFGNIRISDAETYHAMALQIIQSSLDTTTPFWQAPLYPYLLSLFYLLFGSSLMKIQIFHILVGSINCVLLYYVSSSLFNRRTGMISAIIACLYAPAWLFDVHPLATNVITTFYLLVIYLLNSFQKEQRLLTLCAAGLTLGAAVISHGLAFFIIPAVCIWIVFANKKPGRHAGQMRHKTINLVLLFIAVSAVCPAVISLRNKIDADQPVFISYNAGINFYIGHHPQYEKMVGRRNGFEWEEFQRQIIESKVQTCKSVNSYFIKETLKTIYNHPVAFIRTNGKKLMIMLSGVETKRNFPIYPLREQSVLFRSSLWNADLFFFRLFFPTGLIIPFLVLGIAVVLKRKTTHYEYELLPLIMATGHFVGVAVFHVCTRYRISAIFILFPYAAIGITYLLDMCLQHLPFKNAKASITDNKKKSAFFTNPLLMLFVFTLIVSNLAGNFLKAETREKNLAEHCYYQGLWLSNEGYVNNALRLFRMAIVYDPSYPDPKFALGTHYYYKLKNPVKALWYFNELKKILPWNPRAEKSRSIVINDLEKNGIHSYQ